MSSQKGNTKRNRPQKHQNVTAFKNTLHDTSKRSKEINSLEVTDCCERCTEIIEWKIKYKKYKPLTVPKKCVRCSQKAVKKAYCIICQACSEKEGICAKCGQSKDIVNKSSLSASEESSQRAQLEQELKALPERQRRTFYRLQASGKLTEEDEGAGAGAGVPKEDSDSEDCSTNSDLAEEHLADLKTDLCKTECSKTTLSNDHADLGQQEIQSLPST